MSDLINSAGTIGLLQNMATTTRQSPGIDFFIVVGAIALSIGFLGILCIYAAVRQLRVRSELRRNGVTVEGRIMGRRFDPRSKWWMVTYSYDYQGQPYSHEQAVRKKHHLALPEETTVLVHCLAHDPSVARVVNPTTARIILDILLSPEGGRDSHLRKWDLPGSLKPALHGTMRVWSHMLLPQALLPASPAVDAESFTPRLTRTSVLYAQVIVKRFGLGSGFTRPLPQTRTRLSSRP
jgi:hypothetical protein